MRRKKKFVSLLAAVVLSMNLIACGTSGEERVSQTPPIGTSTQMDTTISEQVTETAKIPETSTESTEKTSYPVTVIGSDGTEVEIQSEPKRVISVAPNITEMIFSLGAEEKLVGRTDYCDYPSQVSEIESIGKLSSPDIEKIISLTPDLVIGSTHFSDDVKAQLEQSNIPVLYLYEEHEVNGVFAMIQTLGTALNKQSQAEETVKEMKEKLESVAQKIEGRDPVSVYYVVGFGEGGDYTAGGDTFIHGILTLAGGKNIAADISGWSYSLEALLEADPEVIILPSYAYDEFFATEPYSDLRAVKNQRVYRIDNNMLDRQSSRNADAVIEIAKMLHPDAFQE